MSEQSLATEVEVTDTTADAESQGRNGRSKTAFAHYRRKYV